LVEPFLEEAPFEELCGDTVMGSAAPNIGLIDPICTEPLDLMSFHPLLPTEPLDLMSFHPIYFPPLCLICMHFTGP